MNEKLKYLTLFVIGMMLSLGMNAQTQHQSPVR